MKKIINNTGNSSKTHNKHLEKNKPNKELLEALKESKIILREIEEGKRKGYSNINDLIKSLNS